MINKPVTLVLLLLSGCHLMAMNGEAHVSTLSTEKVYELIEQIWDSRELTPEQKKVRLRLAFQDAAHKEYVAILDRAMNPTEEDAGLPLEEAMTSHKSVELFKILLEYKANPQIGMDKSRTISDQAQKNPDFKQAIEDQGRLDLVVPLVSPALVGEEPLLVAASLRQLIQEGKLTEDQLYKILDNLVIAKDQDKDKLENVSLALESLIAGIPYKPLTGKEKRALREQLAANSGMRVGILGVIGVACAGIAAGIGIKALLDSMQSSGN